ncbi:MAG: hypothetical protein V3T86_08180 [Planctomycetota bacterium]
MTRSDLRIRRLLPIWAPLGLTFLLLSGGTPVINAAINRLPGVAQEEELAAFALLLGMAVLLQSPLFVCREIAIRLSVDRAGSRQALRVCLAASVVVSGLELLLGLTPLGSMVLSLFTENTAIVDRAHGAVAYLSPMPLFVAVRGVYQAHQIRVDDTLFVGAGTLLRLAATAVIGFVFGPTLGMSGAELGTLCMVSGAGIEMLFAVGRARISARPPEHAPAGTVRIDPWRFAIPLMIANSLGVASSVFYLKLTGAVPADQQANSFAAFQEVRSLQWLLVSGAVALQSLTTAKVQTRADAIAMLRFGVAVSGVLTVGFAVCATVPSFRHAILVDMLGEVSGGDAFLMASSAIVVAAAMPLFQGVRFVLRGVLISRGQTGVITVGTVTTLLMLSTALSFGFVFFDLNGALNAYIWWAITLNVEIAILARAVFGAPSRPSGIPIPIRTPRETSAG